MPMIWIPGLEPAVNHPSDSSESSSSSEDSFSDTSSSFSTIVSEPREKPLPPVPVLFIPALPDVVSRQGHTVVVPPRLGHQRSEPIIKTGREQEHHVLGQKRSAPVIPYRKETVPDALKCQRRQKPVYENISDPYNPINLVVPFQTALTALREPAVPKRNFVPQLKFKLDFAATRRRFVNRELDVKGGLRRLLIGKAAVHNGFGPVDVNPFHGSAILPNATRHRISIKVSSTPYVAMRKWKDHCLIEGLPQIRYDYLAELFRRVADDLVEKHGWVRREISPTGHSMGVGHFLERPGLQNLERPDRYEGAGLDYIMLPSKPTDILRKGSVGFFWTRMLHNMFTRVKASRHPSLGLILHSYASTQDDVKQNDEELPPPIWFLIYALQAAFPGYITIREEVENNEIYRISERALPPFALFNEDYCTAFFKGLLGEGFYEVSEAAWFATRSVDVIEKNKTQPDDGFKRAYVKQFNKPTKRTPPCTKVQFPRKQGHSRKGSAGQVLDELKAFAGKLTLHRRKESL